MSDLVTHTQSAERTALYRLFDAKDELLYIGVSWNPKQRWKAHAKDRNWWHEVAHHELTWFPTRPEAQAAEKLAIVAEKPKYNTCHTPRHAAVSERTQTGADLAWWKHARCQDGYRSGAPTGSARNRAKLAGIEQQPES